MTMSFFGVKLDEETSPVDRVEIHYDFRQNKYQISASKVLEKRWLQRRTGKIQSLMDLPNSQIFLTAETGLSRHADRSLNVHAELEYAKLEIGGRSFWFMREDMDRYVNPESGVPMFSFIFPDHLRQLER